MLRKRYSFCCGSYDPKRKQCHPTLPFLFVLLGLTFFFFNLIADFVTDQIRSRVLSVLVLLVFFSEILFFILNGLGITEADLIPNSGNHRSGPLLKLQATVTPFLTEHSIESQFVTDTVAQIAIEIRYGGIGAALFVFVMAGFNWWMCLRSYAQTIFLLRRGQSPIKRDEFNTYCSMSYIGYQISHSALSLILVFVFGTILIIFGHLLYTIPQLRDALIKLLLVSGLSAVIRFVIVSISKHVFTIWKGRYFRFRFVHQFFDLFDIFINTNVGLVSCLIPFIIGSKWVFLNFSRLDVSVLPSGWTSMDAACSSYCSTLLADHYNNNPVKLVFIDMLKKEAEAAIKSNSDASASSIYARSHSLLSAKERSEWAMKKCRLLINLVRNPSVIRYRKHNLRS